MGAIIALQFFKDMNDENVSNAICNLENVLQFIGGMSKAEISLLSFTIPRLIILSSESRSLSSDAIKDFPGCLTQPKSH